MEDPPQRPLHQTPEQIIETCEQLVSRHRNLVPGMDEEDMVQEGCLAALQAAPRYDQARSRPATYTWTAAHRRLIDRYRSVKNKPTCELLNDSALSGSKLNSDEIMACADRAVEAAETILGGKLGRGRTFPLYALCATLVMRQHLRESLRGMVMRLQTCPELRERLHLRRPPTKVTLVYARIAIKRRIRENRRAHA